KEKQLSYKEYTYMANVLFNTIGYDILETKRSTWPYTFLRGYFYFCFVINFYAAFYLTLRVFQLDSEGEGLTRIMRQAMHFSYMFSAEVKFATFIKYRRRLRLLNGNLKDLFPVEEKSREEYEVNRFYLSRGKRYILAFYYLVMVLMMFFPLLQSCIMYWIQGGIEFPYIRIFPTRLSFRADNPLGYMAAYTVDFVYSHLIVNFTLGCDLWMMSESSQLCMHFSHLAKQISSYSPSRENEEKDCAYLSSLIRKHQHILALHSEMDAVFGPLLASNLFTTASLLCCMAFYSATEGFTLDGMSYMVVFLSIVMLFYLVSVHGQMLIDSSIEVAAAAYNQHWYDGSVRYRKMVLILLLRAQRPAEISDWNILIISFDTFKILMTITYRFTAVIRQFTEK
ncbi:hypothetical protein KR018_005109, partial [Drosophila ironensis]